MRDVADSRPARWWHALTAVVCAGALILQLVLVVQGAQVLTTAEPPGLPTRLLRFVSYFTIQSNLLVLASVLPLVRRPSYDGPRWRVVRLDALIGITGTGLIHWFFLRPLLHLTGGPYVADKLLHVVVPLLAVVGWAAFGPRPRIDRRTVALSLVWPLAWGLLVVILLGAVTDWYPYPFVDVGVHGYPRVLLNIAGVGALLLSLAAGLAVIDRRGRRSADSTPDLRS
ncbi:Pr6Pr family membrane protein [Luteipulveratus halotolerans]|uniref:F420-dependent oxidoreductase n=1 Tax=Luteipulveratus halotolerans TaxID=1631356 RepID=A0A0L6CEY8_9MICO|nr:Pr6Pr family membrane protein [Luteipulveratus halotolerans]KNX36377.1 hypothetical protein VV01_03240 [Luteipulveratus halotolerans]